MKSPKFWIGLRSSKVLGPGGGAGAGGGGGGGGAAGGAPPLNCGNKPGINILPIPIPIKVAPHCSKT